MEAAREAKKARAAGEGSDRVHLIAKMREAELFDYLKTSPRGLTADEAAARLARHGPNEIRESKEPLL